MPHPLTTSSKGPKRKLRGLRRYFSLIIREAEEFSISPSKNDWWDFWHYHPDWVGAGNISIRSRIQHLRALLIVLNKINDAKSQFSTDFQSWILLSCQDSSNDSVYLHSPNANNSTFPAMYPEAEWDNHELDTILSTLAPGIAFKVGRACGIDNSENPPARWSSFLIFRPDLGISLI